MITSMTGFGRASATNGQMTVTVELTSVNSKYLDLSVRLPHQLQSKDFDVRSALRSSFGRGKITVSVQIQSSAEGASSNALLDAGLGEQYYVALSNLRKHLKLKDAIKIDHVIQCMLMDRRSEAPAGSDEEWTLAEQALRDAVVQLRSMRANEGKMLERDIVSRLRTIEEIVAKVQQLSVDRIHHERERLRERIARLFESDEIDEQRLEMEIVLVADKLDVSEEVVRLGSHIKYVNELLKSDASEGRKFNFLLQEMHREINTIGSKSSDAHISQLIVSAKDELECIREQVQNIE